MKYVAYLRVSTERQGRSGLGLEAQREAVMRHVNCHGKLLGEYVEVESGKHHDNRPQLQAALAQCRATGATLIVAKLDRLSRNVAFLAALMESGVEFVCADNPMATKLTVHVLAAVAEHERQMISERTRAALQAVKARGVKLGNPNGASAIRRAAEAAGRSVNATGIAGTISAANRHRDRVMPIVEAIRSEGTTTLLGIAAELNRRGILTARGGHWYARTVKNLLERQAGAHTDGGLESLTSRRPYSSDRP
jgi:DNA invertase Pin-like site-specific DNA recombinase